MNPAAAGEPVDLVDPCSRRAARGWLWLAIGALLLAGLFAVLLVLARTPGVRELVPGPSFFRTALAVHVNLSVLVWFLSLAGLFWSLNRRSDRSETLALGLVLVGFVLIGATPFAGNATAHLNNYVPMVEHDWFGAGLLVLGCGVGVQALRALWPDGSAAWTEAPVRLAVGLSAAVYLLALAICLWAWARLPDSVQGEGRYELLFWGGGHVLQLTHTLLVLLSWMLLLRAAGGVWPWSAALTRGGFVVVALPALAAPWIDASFAVDSLEYRRAYTDFMRYAGLAALPLGVVLAMAWLRSGAPIAPQQRPLRAALLASVMLFAVGGVIGFLIEGVNVVIPAHYHGAIVGVTLAFMGMAYWMLPRLGYLAPRGRLACWQPWIYGGGQLLHVLGLAWSGGYGVQRKAVGAEQALRSLPEIIGMGMVGLGGLIAVVGGISFLIVMLRSLLARSEPSQEAADH